MPTYVVQRAQQILNSNGKAVKDSQILLLGVTYKADVADQRESPAEDVALAFQRLGAELVYHDPYVQDWKLGDGYLTCVNDLVTAMSDSDLIVLLQSHTGYLHFNEWPSGTPVLDTRGVLGVQSAQRL